ncbi:MAG: alcohol dehydrogenase [Methyloligella sp.]|nr:MAG: alcohol dehydrogenase [Methyloligella sp.]
MFQGLLIEKNDDKQSIALKQFEDSDLPEGDVVVQVEYSTINYKDALAVTGSSPIAKIYPLVPGIDFAGTVLSSETPEYSAGQKVVLNGWGVGEKHWGGLAERAKVKSDWLVHLPDGFDTKQAMAIGTAGYTAMLCVMALEEQGVKPSDGEIIVSGASGGVGSVAVSVLAKLGYTVVALTGKAHEHDYLKELGATEVLDRSLFSEPGRPLNRERFAGAVDCVGSTTLANICASMKYGGVVTACGLAGGFDFPSTVMPFILRGVTLVGIESVMCPKPQRLEAWRRLAEDLNVEHLTKMSSEIGLSEVIPTSASLLKGVIKGRLIVDVAR